MKRVLVLIAILVASPAIAVVPGSWTHRTEADFTGGKFEKTAVNSRGEVTLAREFKLLLKSEDSPVVISKVVRYKGKIYAGAGDKPVVYVLDDCQPREFAKLPGTMITSLIADDKGLLAASGGKDCGIWRIDAKGKTTKIWSDDSVKYVWDILPGKDGTLFAATGPQGKVFAINAIDAKGQAEVIYNAGKLAKNILCLSKGPGSLIYAGSDQTGLVIEIETKKKLSRVLLDADEKEISAIIPFGGGLYVATSDAAKASPTGAHKPNGVPRNGKPAGKSGNSPVAPKTDKPDQKQPTTAPAADLDLDAVVRKTLKLKTSATKEQTTKAKPDEAQKTVKKSHGRSPISQLTKDDVLKVLEEQSEAASVAATTQPANASKKPATPAGGAKSGPKFGMGGPMTMPSGAMAAMMGGSMAGPSVPNKKGNAVYFIRADGLVQTVFRKPVLILAMRIYRGKLVLGTGNGGKVYSVTLDGEISSELIDTDAGQITSIVASDGELIFATANRGSVGVIKDTYASKGTYVSKEFDAKQRVSWGTMRIEATARNGKTVKIATRTGNVAKAEDGTWGQWSREQPVADDFMRIMSPNGRFIQYRLTFASAGRKSAGVSSVSGMYQMANLPPVVSAIMVKASASGGKAGASGGKFMRTVGISARDANGDKMKYSIFYRNIRGKSWIMITDKLTTPKYMWDTRTVAEGRYELRVVASDSPSNPEALALTHERISEVIVVDNTVPVISDIAITVDGHSLKLNGTAKDATSRITSIAAAIDSHAKWFTLAAADGILDSKSEKFRTVLKDIDPGAHCVIVRVTDEYGNVGYGYVNVTVAARR